MSLLDIKLPRAVKVNIDGKEVDANSYDFSKAWNSIGFTYKIDTSGNVPVFRSFDQLMARLDGQEFVLDSNYGSIFPQPLQSVHGNYSPGVTLLRFSRTPQGLAPQGPLPDR